MKRYRSVRKKDERGWRHLEVTLEPLNAGFEPIVLTSDAEGKVGVVAEMVEVLGKGRPRPLQPSASASLAV